MEAIITNKIKRQSYKRISDERLGETRTMNCGEIAFIVEYNTANDITIQFKTTGELAKSTYNIFKIGKIKSRFTPSQYGVGILGLGTIADENGNQVASYYCWREMLRRCYDTKYHKKYPTYKDCTVDDDWKYYTNFKKWYDENYYENDGKVSHLDKDILVKGNKIYSPNTCIFVPGYINTMFVKSNAVRGKFPIGVSYNENANSYQAACSRGSHISRYIGLYSTPEKAFDEYKIVKEDYIKVVAQEHKDSIPTKLYNAMMKYQVEITD